MGRREKPVDHSRPARGRLAEHLRSWREAAGMTYETLASRTGLSPATLKRAACGATVPKRTTVEAYINGCSGEEEAARAADELWRQARIEERGRLMQLHAPRPELISDEGDLSRALEVVRRRALPGRQRRGRQRLPGPALAKAFARHGVRIEVVRRSDGQRGFVVLARRWVVERTLS